MKEDLHTWIYPFTKFYIFKIYLGSKCPKEKDVLGNHPLKKGGMKFKYMCMHIHTHTPHYKILNNIISCERKTKVIKIICKLKWLTLGFETHVTHTECDSQSVLSQLAISSSLGTC